jgi:hypothetical protein
MRKASALLSLGSLVLGSCTTGHEPNGCGSDLHVAVDGGATVRFEWNSGCDGSGLAGPYRERPESPEAP